MLRSISGVLLVFVVGASLLLNGGCSSGPKMPPPPNLYVQSVEELAETPANRRSADIEIFYATDRKPVENSSPTQRYYDERRSDSLAAGRILIRIGNDLTWDDLVRQSHDSRQGRLPLEIVEAEETLRFPSSIAPPVWVDGKLVPDPAALADIQETVDLAHALLSRRLAETERKEVFVYIHGVGNAFEDPMFRMAELWHFLGRPGVPVVYTWPAIKGGGPLRGYTYARESSEFTVFHLRQFLQTVASCPDVERIHILAHSRGTGVTLSVLRDIRLIYLDDPERGKREFKIGNVILAAPDIDLQVAQQRFRPDHVNQILDRMTIYMTPEDQALGIATFLFKSLTRLGQLNDADLTDRQRQALLENRIGADLIEVEVKKKGAHGHTYWIDNPAVLSDVLLILGWDRDPGAENGRPLIRRDSGMWEIRDGYPYGGEHAEIAK